jgi:hypothetical protein
MTMDEKIRYIQDVSAGIVSGYVESLTAGKISLSDRCQNLELIISKPVSKPATQFFNVKVLKNKLEMSLDLSSETVKNICISSGLMNESLQMKLDVLMDKPVVLNINGKEYTVYAN